MRNEKCGNALAGILMKGLYFRALLEELGLWIGPKRALGPEVSRRTR